jgi:hypothetical protein
MPDNDLFKQALQGATTSIQPGCLVRAGDAVKFIVEARDPRNGATILVVCLTQGEAMAAVAKCVREGHEIMGVTDRKGTLVTLGLPA